MPSRRAVLAAGAVSLVAAGAGVAVGTQRRIPVAAPKPAPVPDAWLVEAVGRERTLIATLTATIAADASRAAQLQPVLGDHSAHLEALLALPGAPTPSPSSTPSASPAPVPAATTAQLVAAETAAYQAAAAQSASQLGTDAALLASIAACESSHAQWLS